MKNVEGDLGTDPFTEIDHTIEKIKKMSRTSKYIVISVTSGLQDL